MQMNELNCASLKASQRLQKAGIVLETEAYWRIPFPGTDTEPHLVLKEEHKECFNLCADFVSAPSMAEVLRELKEISFSIRLQKNGSYLIWLDNDTYEEINRNPTDALIDLLIWVKQTEGGKL